MFKFNHSSFLSMLSQDGLKYTVDMPLSSYQETRNKLNEIEEQRASYSTAADDAARIVILNNIISRLETILGLMFVERL